MTLNIAYYQTETINAIVLQRYSLSVNTFSYMRLTTLTYRKVEKFGEISAPLLTA